MKTKLAILIGLFSALFVAGCGGFVPYVQTSTDDCFGYVALTNTSVSFYLDGGNLEGVPLKADSSTTTRNVDETMTITWNDSRTGSFNVEVSHGTLPAGLIVEFFSTSSAGSAYNGEYYGVVTDTAPLSFGINYRDDGTEELSPGVYTVELYVEQEGCEPITIPVTVTVLFDGGAFTSVPPVDI